MLIPVLVTVHDPEHHPNLRSFMRHYHRVVQVEPGEWKSRHVLVQLDHVVLQATVPEEIDNDDLLKFIATIVVPGGQRIVRCLYIAPISSGFQLVGEDDADGLLIGTCGPKAGSRLKIVKPLTSHSLMPVKHGRVS